MSHRKAVLRFIPASIGLFWLACSSLSFSRANIVAAAGNANQPVYLPARQILPTPTPQVTPGQETLTTNPILLQTMILLSLLVLVVIFWGVWVNRRKTDYE